jgi:beta-galactosidase
MTLAKTYPAVFRLLLLSVVLAAVSLTAPCRAAATPPPAITVDVGGISIHGQRTILLIGTFQPSRTDPSDWDRRLAQFAASGYNTIDCLVPWNFHEQEEGHFDFASPTHDLPHFLRLCQKHHLYVFLRSGPYVCDEWDGGGLPAWLIPQAGLEIRSSTPRFLGYVRQWVSALDKTIRPFQITHGGPIILNQLENELDYFGPAGSDDDRRVYLSALRDYARQDGLDIPLTACVGSPNSTDGPLRRAMGLADGIIPTGNFYGGGAIEARARGFIAAVHGAKSAGGASLAGFPVICSETGRDEAGQRRLLASGLQGVSPFNFVSGSNFLFNNGDTNWNRPLSYISTSVDFGGMIGFSGVQTANWYAARRLAGFVNLVSDALGRAQSDTSWEGGFSASNPALGADEGGGKTRRLYRLTAPNGPQFVFLWNGDDHPQATTLTVSALTLPRHSTLTVTPGYDQIVPMNLSLASWGLPSVTLHYATVELYGCERLGQTTTLTLVGKGGDAGEFSLSAAPIKVFAKGSPARIYADGSDWTAAYQTGGTRSLTLLYGARRLVVRLLSRQDLDAAPAAAPPSRDLRAGDWHSSDVPLPSTFVNAARRFDGMDPPTMEEAGLWHGAAWYEAAFDAAPTPGGAAPALILAHAGDLVTATLNGQCLGTQCGVGSEVQFDTAGALKNGRNTLAVRVEVWGHANFDDRRNPSLRLNSPRGMWGPVRMGEQPLTLADGWRVTAEEPLPPVSVPGPSSAFDVGETGARRWHERMLTLSSPVLPTGYVLTLGGKNVLGHLFVNGHPLGRCLFGPVADPHMAGGPADQFYIPAAWLSSSRPNRLSVWTLATGPEAALSKMDWASVPAGRGPV